MRAHCWTVSSQYNEMPTFLGIVKYLMLVKRNSYLKKKKKLGLHVNIYFVSKYNYFAGTLQKYGAIKTCHRISSDGKNLQDACGEKPFCSNNSQTTDPSILSLETGH